MVLERNTQTGTDSWEIRGINLQDSAGQSCRTAKSPPWKLNSSGLTTGTKHRTIEVRVVRGQERSPAHEIANARPQFRKRGLIRHLLPGDSMNVSEAKSFSRRPNQPVTALGNLPILHFHQSDRASTIKRSVGCLEIYGDKAHELGFLLETR